MHRKGLSLRRLPARQGSGPRRAARDGRLSAPHRRRHQGHGSRYHASGDLQPARGNARAHATWLDKLAALVLLGHRQVGKTTLTLETAQQRPSVQLDLECDADRHAMAQGGPHRAVPSAWVDINVLLRQSTKSPAERVRDIKMPPLLLDEVGEDRLNDLWLRGGFSDTFQADSDRSSMTWRADFLPSL